MAERACWPYSLVLTLSYSEDRLEWRDAAQMFCYADVRLFFARLRDAAFKAAKRAGHRRPIIRFLCAGEQGDENARCHWHIVVYSDWDIMTLGNFRGMKNGRLVSLSRRADLMTVGKRKRRISWSLWEPGFTTFQEADKGGMNYVLSYCLKDQFTHEKSEGTMREAKVETFATGLFRMSKRPAIGEDFLMRKMEVLLEKNAVLPSLNLSVPDLGGYWHPNGLFREKLLWSLVALNQRIVWATGANAPQWSSLVASCRDNEKDMEILNGLPKEQETHPDDPDYESVESEFAKRATQGAREQSRRDLVRTCANLLPCTDCLHQLSEQTLSGLGVVRFWPEDGGEWQYVAADGHDEVGYRQSQRGGGLNPYCQKKGSKLSRFVFPKSGSAASGG